MDPSVPAVAGVVAKDLPKAGPESETAGSRWTSSANESNNSGMESVLRITLAGCGGSMVGLALLQQQLQQQRQQQQPPSTIPRSVRGGAVTITTGTPPSHVSPITPSATTIRTTGTRTLTLANRMESIPPHLRQLPKTWAISCMMFVLVLESSRWISPTRHGWELLAMAVDRGNDPNVPASASLPQSSPPPPPLAELPDWVQTSGDYALGGMVAGAVAAQQQQPQQNAASGNGYRRGGVVNAILRGTSSSSIIIMQRSPFTVPHRSVVSTRWGMVVGLGLGLTAGVFQAGMDTTQHYLEQWQQNQQNSQ